MPAEPLTPRNPRLMDAGAGMSRRHTRNRVMTALPALVMAATLACWHGCSCMSRARA
jgi:hypothetical protein